MITFSSWHPAPSAAFMQFLVHVAKSVPTHLGAISDASRETMRLVDGLSVIAMTQSADR
ncbi:hypothetical protein [Variovorax sp. OV700]|uniref:hypothetical protein n=1 Tax=Variovorax sp. OV700 TaxID=1882826 RepID=UPI0015872903|nr:hypothetical protein [Variovorax sp. OV700]